MINRLKSMPQSGLRLWIRALIFMLPLGLKAQEVKKLSLEQAISLGLENSKALHLSKSRIEVAQAKYQQLRALQFPQVKAFSTYSKYNDVPEFLFPGQTVSSFPNIPNVYRNGVALVQPVSGGFRARAMLESGELLAKAVAMDAEKDEAEIKLNLVATYFNLYKLEESKKLIDENLASTERRLKDVQNLAKNGLAPRNDVLRAELQVSNMRLAQIDAMNALQVANFNFGILLGLPENVKIQVESATVYVRPTKTYEEYVQDGIQKRPDHLAAAFRLKTAQNNLKVSRAGYFPVISLNANYLNANPNPRLIPAQAKWFNTWDFGVSLAYDLTGLFTNKHQLAEAKAQIVQGRLGLDQTQDQIRMDVNQQYLTYIQQSQKLEVSRQAVAQATENYRVVKNKYDNQVALLTEVLDADVLLLQTKLNDAVARADAELAYQKLLKSTGNF
ncbi:MAG: TolC family protein [Sphingobacteriaceae bacterium]